MLTFQKKFFKVLLVLVGLMLALPSSLFASNKVFYFSSGNSVSPPSVTYNSNTRNSSGNYYVSPISGRLILRTNASSNLRLMTQVNVLHRVNRGESLFLLAQRYGSTINSIKNANALRSDLIRVGQVLRIPISGQDATSSKPAPVPEKPAPAPEPDPEPPAPDPIPEDPGVADLHASEQRMLELMNEERRKVGVAPLKIDMEVVKVVRLKSEDMIRNNYFAHNSPVYGTPFEMLRSFGISYTMAGENIALAPTVDRAHTALMNSAGHRRNILNPQFTHIGLGFAQGSRGQYYTQMFIRK